MFKTIPDFPDYSINIHGDVFSRLKNKLMRPYRSPTHGFRIGLRKDKKAKVVRIAYLLLTTFISPRPKDAVICHGIKGLFNDSLDNISWGTVQKNNGEDKRRDGTLRYGEQNNLHKLNELQVRIIRKSYSWRGIGGLDCSQLAEVFNVSYDAVYRIIKRYSWRHI